MPQVHAEPPPTATSFRLPIAGDEPSHLAVRLEAAGEPADGAGTSATAVLYMHGFASSHSGSKAAFFRRGFRQLGLAFCSFDFQGHGDSGGSMRDLTLTRNLADMRRVQERLRGRRYRRWVLFGSSMGAATALWYAARHPRDVAAVIAISPALEIEKSLLARAGSKGARRWRRDGTIVLQHPLGPQELGWGLIEDLRAHELAELKSSYATPALIFQGQQDDSVDWRTTVDFATGCDFSGIELHLMADGDHRLADRLDHVWRIAASYLEARGIV